MGWFYSDNVGYVLTTKSYNTKIQAYINALNTDISINISQLTAITALIKKTELKQHSTEIKIKELQEELQKLKRSNPEEFI